MDDHGGGGFKLRHGTARTLQRQVTPRLFERIFGGQQFAIAGRCQRQEIVHGTRAGVASEKQAVGIQKESQGGSARPIGQAIFDTGTRRVRHYVTSA